MAHIRLLYLSFLLMIGILPETTANVGDTTLVRGFDHFLHQNCNSGTQRFLFPPDSARFYKVMLHYQLTCPSFGCDIYDRIATLKLLRPTGVLDSTVSLAPSFTVNGMAIDTFSCVFDTAYTYSFDTVSQDIDSIPMPGLTVLFYSDPQTPTTPTDTLVVWPLYYHQYQFDSAGNPIDSVLTVPDSTYYLTRDSVWSDPFEVLEPIEIARAITPFGEAVSLWFDVSDYSNLLRDSVTLYTLVCGYSNGWEVTTDFYFIEGEPFLEPFRHVNLWNGTWQYGNTGNPIDSHLQPISIDGDTAAGFARIRLVTTGHGFGGDPNPDVAEFYDVTHHLLINGDTLDQRLWRSDCGRNPLYPQGAPGFISTWFYRRANWCPGSFVTPHDYVISDQVRSGNPVIVDYEMQPYTVTGGPAGFYFPEYYVQSQAIYYRAPGYSNNAAVLEIMRPNDAFDYNRLNPACDDQRPLVRFRNLGGDTLRSLEFHYGLDGDHSNSYTWTGALPFLDTLVIALPAITQTAGSHIFSVILRNPNGQPDQFGPDDSLNCTFSTPAIYNTSFIRILVKTDGSPSEISTSVTDAAGNILFSRANYPAAGSLYIDTVFLSNGCYSFNVFDSFGDGLCCFGGSGYFRVLKGGTATVICNANDFGENFSKEAVIDFSPGIDDLPAEASALIWPNPSYGLLHVNLSRESGRMEARMLDVSGRTVMEFPVTEYYRHEALLDASMLPQGMYFLELTGNGWKEVLRWIRQ